MRAETGSLLVHVEGTRQTEAGQKTGKISSLWIDVALERGMPIVPVAFRGGLGGGHRHDVPPRRQVHHVGRPILPAELAAIPYARRRTFVSDAIDALGTPEAAPDAAALDPRAALGEALADFLATTQADAGWLAKAKAVVRRP